MVNKVIIPAVSICLLLSISSFSTVLIAQEKSSSHDVLQNYLTMNQPEIRVSSTNMMPFTEEIIIPPMGLGQYYAPGEIIVKFKAQLGMHVLDLFSEKRSFSETGRSYLDHLTAKYQVSSIKRVFQSLEQQARLQGKEQFTNAELFIQMQDKNPQRAQRAPLDSAVPDLENIFLIKLDEDANILQVIADYEKDASVVYAEPNWKLYLDLVPNDPYYPSSGSWGQDYPDLYGLHLIDTSDAWDVTTGATEVVVAMVDTGVDYTHEDMQGNIWINDDEVLENGIDDDNDGFIDNIYGADFFYNDGDPEDGFGHGTHCAGTIAAVGNNTKGVVGVNWQTKIMAVKIGSNQGSLATVETLADSLVWAAAQGADVISMSWGGSANSDTLYSALEEAYGLGVCLVAAAGNSGSPIPHYPAAYPIVIAVAATDWNDQKASFSNYGTWVDVCAPGVNILSLRAAGVDPYGDGTHIVDEIYYRASGTSMACPHVAGLAALLLSVAPGFTNEQIANRIVGTTDSIDEINPEYGGFLGSGRINTSLTVHVYEHNIGVSSLSVSDTLLGSPGETITVETTILNSGINSEHNILINLRAEEQNIDTFMIPFLTSYETQVVTFEWTAPDFGVYHLVVNATVPNVIEDDYTDNEKNERVTVGICNIDIGEYYSSIQAAVKSAHDDNTIIVPDGFYHESILIRTNITLQGESQEGTILEPSYDEEHGILIQGTDHVLLHQFTVQCGIDGILISNSSNTQLNKMIISNHVVNGIVLQYAHNVTIIQSKITGNGYGVHFSCHSNNSTIIENELTSNERGIFVENGCSGSRFYHNTFVNTVNAYDAGNNNRWNCSYYEGMRVSGGNFWCDYSGVDLYSGPDQNISGSDRIGDTPYEEIAGEHNNIDWYPLMRQWNGMIPMTFYVDDDAEPGGKGTLGDPFRTISDGIDHATVDGDSIFVRTGTYPEQLILIHQKIRLIGEDPEDTIIDLHANQITAIIILADYISIQGFTILCEGNGVGIYADYAIISGNRIFDDDLQSAESGIYLESSSNTMIDKNLIREKQYGIMLGYSIYNTSIENNTFEDIIECGLVLLPVMGSSADNISICRNTFTDAGYVCSILVEPIFSSSLSNISISNNTVNHYQYDLGIGIFAAIDSSIENLLISNNTCCCYTSNHGKVGITIGLFVSSSCTSAVLSQNTVTGYVGVAGPGGSDGYGIFVCNDGGRTSELSLYENTFTGNDFGLYLTEGVGSATLTRIFHNNFIGSLKAQINDSTALSIYGEYPGGGNYWDDFNQADEGAFDVFRGEHQDIDGADGIVDTPYTGIEGGLHEDSYPLMSIYSAALSADAYGPYEGAVGIPIQFISSTSGGFPPYSWFWEFGDPAHHMSTDPSPLFTYDEVGTYLVTFMVIDSHGVFINDITTAAIDIIVADANGPYNGFVNVPVQFTGSVLGGTPEYIWLWEFGDNTSSSLQHPTHEYANDDIYEVKLTVTDNEHRQHTDSTTATILGIPFFVYVDDDFGESTPGWGYNCFTTIQEGINAVPNRGSVFVAAGQYNENVVVNKSINLYGESQQTTVIAGNTPGTAVSISAYSINLSGFTVYTHKALQNGISVVGTSKYNVITNNTILSGNENGTYSTGIYISSSSSHNTICGNIIENTRIGMFIEGSSNTITENTFIHNNNRGIVAYYDTSQNLFSVNNFFLNNKNAQDLESNFWDNGTMGNYWDDYTGVDENCDGIGDTPYQIPGGNNFDSYPLMEPYDLFHVDAQGPYFGMVNESIGFSGSVSGGSPPYMWLWEFGDNTTSPLQNPSHEYSKVGTYEVQLKVIDCQGKRNIDSTTATISEDTVPPEVVFIVPHEGYIYISDFFSLKRILTNKTLIIGQCTVTARATDQHSSVKNIEFYIDGVFQANGTIVDPDNPLDWECLWNERTPLKFKHIINIIAYDDNGNSASAERTVWKFF